MNGHRGISEGQPNAPEFPGFLYRIYPRWLSRLCEDSIGYDHDGWMVTPSSLGGGSTSAYSKLL